MVTIGVITMSSNNQDILNDKRVLVVVPAHNEAGSIGGVLQDLKTHAPWADVVVVDDCSTDNTAALAQAGGAVVLRLTCNLNVGGAVQTGYQYAQENDYDIAIQFDGDGQHRAVLIHSLVEKILTDQVDVVIGSRLVKGLRFRFNPLRFIGSRLLSWIVSTIAKQRITDPTSGFRAFSRRAIRFFSRHYPQSYLGDTAEALVWAAKHKMKITEVPARMRQRNEGQSATNSVKGFVHTMRIILAVLIDCIETDFEQRESS